MNLLPQVEDWGLENQQGILLVDGVSCSDLVREFGTPLHVVHEKRLQSNIKRFKDAFSSYQQGVQVFYSYKSNGIPGVLKIIHQGEASKKKNLSNQSSVINEKADNSNQSSVISEKTDSSEKAGNSKLQGRVTDPCHSSKTDNFSGEGLGAEVISPYELWLALRMGVAPWRIVYNGINKSLESLRLALKLKVRINADSLEEVKQIEAEAKRLDVTCEIGIRVCPRAGWNSHFGMSMADDGSGFHPLKYGGRRSVSANGRQGASAAADQAIEYISRSSHLVCTGLMCHLTTRATDGETHARACLDLLQFASRIHRSHGIKIKTLDLGGGFGIPTVKGFSHWEALQYRLWNRPPRAPHAAQCQPIEDVASRILSTISEGCERFGLDPPVLCLEPGRIITSDAQVLLLTIGGIKQRREQAMWRGKKQVFALTDGGRFNINYPLEHEYHTAFVANKLNETPRQKYFVVGRLCSPGDWVYRNIHLPYLQAGDVLAIMDSGAYFTQFSTNFSYPRAAVVAVQDGQARILRHRETHECMISMDRI
jgi:diaminopimelate decarboxylase